MVRRVFSAAHFLPGYDGKCKYLHGHNWTVEVFLTTSHLKDGLGIDFEEIKNKLDEILEEFDHTNLNDHKWFKNHPPSCENIAYYIHWKLTEAKWNINYSSYLESVRIWESENAYAEYIED